MTECSKNASVVSYCPVLQLSIPPLSFSSFLFKNTESPPIGLLTHVWASTNTNREAVLNQFSHAKVATMDK